MSLTWQGHDLLYCWLLVRCVKIKTSLKKPTVGWMTTRGSPCQTCTFFLGTSNMYLILMFKETDVLAEFFLGLIHGHDRPIRLVLLSTEFSSVAHYMFSPCLLDFGLRRWLFLFYGASSVSAFVGLRCRLVFSCRFVFLREDYLLKNRTWGFYFWLFIFTFSLFISIIIIINLFLFLYILFVKYFCYAFFMHCFYASASTFLATNNTIPISN